MKKGPDGSKGDGDSRIQAEEPQAPPLNNRESGTERQSPGVTVTLEERQHSLQSVTCNNCPTAAKELHPNKGNNSAPLIAQSTDFHLNEIGRALNEFDPNKDFSHFDTQSKLPSTEFGPHASVKNNSTILASNGSEALNFGLKPKFGKALNEVDPNKEFSHIGNHVNLPFMESGPHAAVKSNSTIPASIGNGSAALNSGLQPELNTHDATNSARDNQSPRVSTLAPKPRWSRVRRVSSTPKEEVSQGNPNYGKRPFTLNDDHSKLPNKRCQVHME
nr:hypothetical protein CFP56_53831 [Quercus suber]